MQIISNEEFQCYETFQESWPANGKQITLDGNPLISIPEKATNLEVLAVIFPNINFKELIEKWVLDNPRINHQSAPINNGWMGKPYNGGT